jgi:UDP-glucose:(heptosyl)LPS alpha-1,3-glucosyltransferase
MHLAFNFQRVDPARGGAETYVAELCRHAIQAGHRVDLYTESWADDCLPREVNVVPVPAPGRTKLERTWSFARNSETVLQQTAYACTVGFINTWAHDVIIPQGGVQEASLRANARRFSGGVPRRLYRLAKMANPKYWAIRAIERRQYDPQRQARVVAVSNMVSRHLQQVHKLPRQRIDVIPNAIDSGRLDVSQPGALRCAFRNRLGLEPGDLVGLFAGHNFALKGLKPLLAALGARRQRDRTARSIHLLVCGNGEPGPYRRLASGLGLADAVHFLGFYPDLRDCYWSSDFFVQPTYYDPCSLVVLEALACGLPVITTAQNGASELLTEGRQGHVLTTPRARDELIAALDQMTRDGVRRAMSAQAYQLGRLQTFETHVARLMTIFEEVAAAKSRRGKPVRSRDSKTRATVPHLDRTRRVRR